LEKPPPMTASGQSPACWPSYIVSDSDRTKKGLIIIIIIMTDRQGLPNGRRHAAVVIVASPGLPSGPPFFAIG
jgi:hypothetical protein